jgi:hypothetical protein
LVCAALSLQRWPASALFSLFQALELGQRLLQAGLGRLGAPSFVFRALGLVFRAPGLVFGAPGLVFGAPGFVFRAALGGG